MAYTTEARVESEFKDVNFTATSAVTSTDVAGFIEEADAEINATLSGKYLTPITGTESLLVVRQISTWLVADRVRYILRVKTGDEGLRQGAPESYGRLAREMLQKLVKGTLKLNDAMLASTSDGVRSFAVDESLEHTFKKSVDQW